MEKHISNLLLACDIYFKLYVGLSYMQLLWQIMSKTMMIPTKRLFQLEKGLRQFLSTLLPLGGWIQFCTYQLVSIFDIHN